MSGDAVEAQHGPPDAYQARSDAFISYASQDKALAETLCRALERAGIGCWIAPRDVTPGEFYADAIVGGINASRVLVVVLTESAIASQHVLREVERASAKRHPVVSFRIGTAPLPAGLEYFLSASHWLDGTATSIDVALPNWSGRYGACWRPYLGSVQFASATIHGHQRTIPAYSRRQTWPGVTQVALRRHCRDRAWSSRYWPRTGTGSRTATKVGDRPQARHRPPGRPGRWPSRSP